MAIILIIWQDEQLLSFFSAGPRTLDPHLKTKPVNYVNLSWNSVNIPGKAGFNFVWNFQDSSKSLEYYEYFIGLSSLSGYLLEL
jgi:hypothetical protein